MSYLVTHYNKTVFSEKGHDAAGIFPIILKSQFVFSPK